MTVLGLIIFFFFLPSGYQIDSLVPQLRILARNWLVRVHHLFSKLHSKSYTQFTNMTAQNILTGSCVGAWECQRHDGELQRLGRQLNVSWAF